MFPYDDDVPAFPCWANIPRNAMEAVWEDLHRAAHSRANAVRALKKVDTKAWISIVRDKACVSMDMSKWGNIVRMLALDFSEDDIRDACPLPESDEDADAMVMAKKILYRAVNGELDIDDNERIKAAQMILRLGPGKSTEKTTITVTTGVPRE